MSHGRWEECRYGFPKPVRMNTEIEIAPTRFVVHNRRLPGFECYNACNPWLSQLWRSNTDVKLVGNAAGIATYICAYVAKPESEKHQTIQALLQLVQTADPHMPCITLLRRVINSIEGMRYISAQEAAWIMLRQPLHDISK